MNQTPGWIVGIDEAGRGPLAGPVAVGAVILSPEFDPKLVAVIKNKDSKKLNPQKRAFWYAKMQDWKKQGIINFHVALVSAEIIDKKGISFAINKGIAECLRKIKADTQHKILLDGSLKAPEKFTYQKTIVKGDEKEHAIRLASIAAKVVRDQKMEDFSEEYPKYGFDIHKGYATKLHRDSIRLYGPIGIHRKSFIRKILT